MRHSGFVLCSLLLSVLAAAATFAQTAPVAQAAAGSAPAFGDPAAFLAAQFGSSFKLDRKIPPLFGDLRGDGHESVVLVATSPTPLLGQEKYRYKVVDPYDAYYGTANPKITSTFSLHFDGSERLLLVVFDWRQPDPKHITKYVIINTPFESVSLADLRLKKKKNLQAIEAVDRTTLHALVFWDGKNWHWSAQGMDSDDEFKMPPSDDNVKMPPQR
jgi:hypothetical protein